MPSVLLLRHAQASFGAADYDVLSDLGRAQVAVLESALRRRGIRIDQVISGSLVRQRETAAALAAAFDRELRIDPRWNEYDSDDILAGHASEGARLHAGPAGSVQLSSAAFQDVLDGALADWIDAGAEAAATEAWPQFAARVDEALADVCAGLGRGETALVCTSGGVLAAACAGILGAASTFVALHRVLVNAGLTTIAVGRSGTSLLSFNDHAHLQHGDGSLVTFR